jgi:sec-independent protein translocase protein TatC
MQPQTSNAQPPSTNGQNDIDPDDFFAHTRMSLGDHLEELRGALWRALYGLAVGVIVGFCVASKAMQWIEYPIKDALAKFEKDRLKRDLEKLEKEDAAFAEANKPQIRETEFNKADLRKAVGLDAKGVDPEETVKLRTVHYPLKERLIMRETEINIQERGAIKALSPTEGFLYWMKIAVYVGIVLSSPWVFYQIWMFVAAGLYPHEKKYVHRYLPLSLFLFLGGVALCEFVALPLGLKYLLEFNESLGIESDMRLSEVLNFLLLMPLVFGLAFQTPLVMLFMERLGIFDVEMYTQNRRMAIFIIAVIAAFISVAPDPISIAVLAIPMVLLYEFGILLCKISPRPAPIEEPDEEPVEV